MYGPSKPATITYVTSSFPRQHLIIRKKCDQVLPRVCKNVNYKISGKKGGVIHVHHVTLHSTLSCFCIGHTLPSFIRKIPRST